MTTAGRAGVLISVSSLITGQALRRAHPYGVWYCVWPASIPPEDEVAASWPCPHAQPASTGQSSLRSRSGKGLTDHPDMVPGNRRPSLIPAAPGDPPVTIDRPSHTEPWPIRGRLCRNACSRLLLAVRRYAAGAFGLPARFTLAFRRRLSPRKCRQAHRHRTRFLRRTAHSSIDTASPATSAPENAGLTLDDLDVAKVGDNPAVWEKSPKLREADAAWRPSAAGRCVLPGPRDVP